MGWLMDKLKNKLKKTQGSKAVTIVTKIPHKDITFLPASVNAAEITTHIENRTQSLMSQAGGEDKYSETDFNIYYINKLADHDMVQEYSLQKEQAKEGSSAFALYDWEPKSIVTEIKDSVDIGTKQFYMILIEYTVIK